MPSKVFSPNAHVNWGGISASAGLTLPSCIQPTLAKEISWPHSLIMV